MNIWPLRFRRISGNQIIFANDCGNFFMSDEDFLLRYVTDKLKKSDIDFLEENGHAYNTEGGLSYTSFCYNWSRRLHIKEKINYVMLVPTLRCNQSCTYCQVSRVPESAIGYDWTDYTTNMVIKFLSENCASDLKVEFQGGEPLLRVDILEKIREFCRCHFQNSEFVVCTNMLSLGDREWKFLESNDTYVSTSIDGDFETHNRQRLQNVDLTSQCFKNIEKAIRLFGSSQVSALPTIDVECPPEMVSFIETYESLGINSIYLRPVNYQGFARKKKQDSISLANWNRWYNGFIDFLVERNAQSENYVEEYYFTHCLKRIFRYGIDNHVNIRNPNLFGTDYIVIDFDGTLYPTDESRMLQRIDQIDLSIGSAAAGIDNEKVKIMNASSFNNFDPDCIHCPYQPFCTSDVIDDISRYGRIDYPRHQTWFCGRQISLFDKAIKMIYQQDLKTQDSLSQWLGIASWPDLLAPIHQ